MHALQALHGNIKSLPFPWPLRFGSRGPSEFVRLAYVMECIDVESLGRRSYMDLASFVSLLMLRLLGARIVLLGGLPSLNVNRAKGLDDVNRLLGPGGVCKPSSSIVT